jgi:hypothetical protein
VIILAAALVAAVIAPNMTGRRIAGEPVAGAVAGPPASGDCVTWMADPWPRFDHPAPQIDDVFAYPTAAVGPCTGPIAAEVVSVTPEAAPPDRISATDYLSQMSQCPIDAIAYTGSIPPVVDVGGSSVVWAARPGFRYTQVGPDRAQRAQGQRWSACLIGADDGAPYVGRLRDVLTTGMLPPTLGACLTSVDPADANQVACDRPHPAEELATARLGPRAVSGADLRQACAVFAGRALRTSDPTRGGALRIEVVASREWGATVIGPSAGSFADTFVTCVAVAQTGTLLVRSLIGVADGPLPVG